MIQRKRRLDTVEGRFVLVQWKGRLSQWIGRLGTVGWEIRTVENEIGLKGDWNNVKEDLFNRKGD